MSAFPGEHTGRASITYIVRQRSTARLNGATPPLFRVVHGWPGSFLEVTKVPPLLTEASADHPSVWVETRAQSILITSFTPREQRLAVHTKILQNGSGYSAEQFMKPQTLGFSIAGSIRPLASSRWKYEKLVAWTDDEVITWVSISWFSRSGPAASVWIYYELARAGQIVGFPKTSVPVGLSYFPKDLVQSPRTCVRAYHASIFVTDGVGVGGPLCGIREARSTRSVGELWKMFGKSGPAVAVRSRGVLAGY
ncbi:hypothetical protein EI94DRAFT_1790952 [Lactarius quietus]|nr:hypothetical protein EI94DRAFT_1790952 [Lactarius quietus]